MLTRRSARMMLAPIAVGAALLSMAGCGGFSPGDHVFYRLALEATKETDGCFQNEMIPDNQKDDTTSVRSGATFILYATGDDELALDTGLIVLGGKPTDAGYEFSGTTENVDYPLGDVADIKLTTTRKTTVDMTVEGATVDGTMKTVTDTKCEGAGCSGDDASTCTRTNEFRGIVIEQANVGLGGDLSPDVS
jgi:hypothetical protein